MEHGHFNHFIAIIYVSSKGKEEEMLNLFINFEFLLYETFIDTDNSS